MSVVSSFLRGIGRRAGQRFAAHEYWERRHQSRRGQLSAVGHAQLSDRANAAQYDQKRQRLLNMLARQVPDPSGRSLLDAGCGVGVLSAAYESLGFEVVGVDFSRTAIEEASASGLRARWVVGQIADLDLSTRFDVVMAVDVLLHVVDDRMWRASLGALAKHLRPDGVVILLDHLHRDDANQVTHVKTRSKGEYVDALGEVGLFVTEHESFHLAHEAGGKDLLAIRKLNS